MLTVQIWSLINLAIDLVSFYCFGRVVWELKTNEDSRKIHCVLHLPLIVSTFLFTLGFGTINIMFLLSNQEFSCSDTVAILFSHVGVFGLLGWLPSILAAVYVPFIALSSSSDISRRLEMKDVRFASIWAGFTTLGFWLIVSIFSSFDDFSEYSFYCQVERHNLLAVLGIQVGLFVYILGRIWLSGLREYFQTVLHQDGLSVREVITHHNTLRNSVNGREDDCQDRQLQQLCDLLTDTYTPSVTAEINANLALSVSAVSPRKLEKVKEYTGVVMTYDSQFRSSWVYILTVIGMSILSFIIDIDIISAICFTISRTCGIQACILFFKSKILLQHRRHLFPCLRCCHASQKEVNAIVANGISGVAINISPREGELPLSPDSLQDWSRENTQSITSTIHDIVSLQQELELCRQNTTQSIASMVRDIISLKQELEWIVGSNTKDHVAETPQDSSIPIEPRKAVISLSINTEAQHFSTKEVRFYHQDSGLELEGVLYDWEDPELNTLVLKNDIAAKAQEADLVGQVLEVPSKDWLDMLVISGGISE